MRLFQLFQSKQPPIDVVHESKRLQAGLRIVAMINNSVTMEQLQTVARMIEQFEMLYGKDHPMWKFWKYKSFEIENACV